MLNKIKKFVDNKWNVQRSFRVSRTIGCVQTKSSVGWRGCLPWWQSNKSRHWTTFNRKLPFTTFRRVRLRDSRSLAARRWGRRSLNDVSKNLTNSIKSVLFNSSAPSKPSRPHQWRPQRPPPPPPPGGAAPGKHVAAYRKPADRNHRQIGHTQRKTPTKQKLIKPTN